MGGADAVAAVPRGHGADGLDGVAEPNPRSDDEGEPVEAAICYGWIDATQRLRTGVLSGFCLPLPTNSSDVIRIKPDTIWYRGGSARTWQTVPPLGRFAFAWSAPCGVAGDIHVSMGIVQKTWGNAGVRGLCALPPGLRLCHYVTPAAVVRLLSRLLSLASTIIARLDYYCPP